MKKNIKIKSIRHAELVSASHQYGFRNKFGMTEGGEQGRSMVEMLGVLAVMGILSVGGVAMYTSAMNKHRANELLNEASKRAAIVAVQATQGRENLSISEFGTENTRLNFSETVDHDTTNNQFTLTINGVAEAVCQQMNNAKGPVIRKFEPKTCSGDNNTVKLTYNDDMSSTAKASDFNGDETGCKADSSRQYCASNDTCISATDTCPSTGPSCPGNSSATEITDGTSFTVTESGESITCWCPAGQSYQSTGCANVPTTGCDNHTTNQCGLGYYCQFSPNDCDDNKGGNPNGVCTPVGSGTPLKDGAYLKGPRTDWWSAYSWCIGNNMNLVRSSIAGHSLSSSYENYDGNGDLYTYFGQDMTFWTGHDYDSCYAWEVDANSNFEYVNYYHRHRSSDYYALCE